MHRYEVIYKTSRNKGYSTPIVVLCDIKCKGGVNNGSACALSTFETVIDPTEHFILRNATIGVHLNVLSCVRRC